MRKEGFTLIELIIVIVIIGILAAIAVPKFAGLTKDAKISAVKGFGGSIRAAAHIVHAKWLTQCNVEDNCSGYVSLNGVTVKVDNTSTDKVQGYPLANNSEGIQKAVDYDNDTFKLDNATNCTIFYYTGTSDSNLKSTVCSNTANVSSCTTSDCGLVYYYDGTAAPNIVICTSGCK